MPPVGNNQDADNENQSSKDEKIQISILKYIEATSLSARRSRIVILILCFASFIGFNAYWNSRDASWSQMRYKSISKAFEYFARDTVYKDISIYKREPGKEEIKRFLHDRGINTQMEFEDLRQLYNDIRKNIYTVSIPILGIRFDINDLGVLTGITFIVLLILLAYYLFRECENLQITFEKSYTDIKNLEFYYNYASMGQVLTVPPNYNGKPNYVRTFLPKFLYLLPPLVQCLIFINDMYTLSHGDTISQPATRNLQTLSLLFIFSVGIFTIIAIHFSYKKDKLWSAYHLKVTEICGKQKSK